MPGVPHPPSAIQWEHLCHEKTARGARSAKLSEPQPIVNILKCISRRVVNSGLRIPSPAEAFGGFSTKRGKTAEMVAYNLHTPHVVSAT